MKMYYPFFPTPPRELRERVETNLQEFEGLQDKFSHAATSQAQSPVIGQGKQHSFSYIYSIQVVFLLR